MLRFESSVAGDVLLLDGPAAQLLELLGHPGSRKGAIMPEDLPEAIAKLSAGLEQRKAATAATSTTDTANAPVATETRRRGYEEEPTTDSISLEQRAWPLLEMLKLAQAQGKHVSWGT